jgi:hypothetical protein
VKFYGGVEQLAGSPDCKSGSTDMQVRLLSPPLEENSDNPTDRLLTTASVMLQGGCNG